MSKLSSILSISNLSVGYTSQIINDINIDFYPGEFVALMGKNGTGKSTFLKTLCGILPSQSGTISIAGKKVHEMNAHERAMLVSFVSTHLPAMNLSVRELVELGRLPYTNWMDKKNSNDEQLISEALDVVHLMQMQQKKLYELSDGEKQRAVIARALVQDTPLVLLDEPVAYLDVQNKFDVLILLKQLADKGKTVLFSSHDFNIVMQMVDNLLIINNKKIISGSPEDHIINKNILALSDHKEVVFDLQKGGFVLKKNQKSKIGIMGEGEIVNILLNALARIGLYGVCNKTIDLNVKILCSNGNYQYQLECTDERCYNFGTIYELITFLKTNNT